ncbi:DUF1850 domain-containing protein [Bacillus spongiae]|uniref:DUF1850 domain-containing protein n=1 Tax=Bacillus spongiae TaxID=2683610 RepID=A0ABU8HBN7_9BACI
MRYKLVFSVVILTLLFILMFLPFRLVFIMEDSQGKQFAYSPIHVGERFQIEYTHSIHLSQVEEWYKVGKNLNIVQTKLTFEDTAIGMPATAGEGETFTLTEDGQYELSNMSREFPSINMRVGQVKANHLLHINDATYPFTSFFDGGTGIKISIKKLSVWQMWKGVKIHE